MYQITLPLLCRLNLGLHEETLFDGLLPSVLATVSGIPAMVEGRCMLWSATHVMRRLHSFALDDFWWEAPPNLEDDNGQSLGSSHN